MTLHPCFFCFSSQSVALKIDQDGRIFASCKSCGVSTLCPTSRSLRLFNLLGDSLFVRVRNLLKRKTSDAELAHEWKATGE